MTVPHVLVGLDDSSCSGLALQWAVRHAAERESSVQALSCWSWPMAVALAGYAVDLSQDCAAATARQVAEALEATGLSQVRIDQRVVEGSPGRTLVGASRAAELLVVGSSGRGALTAAVLGSVSRYCVTHASCPVVVIRPAEPGEPSQAGCTSRRAVPA